MMRCARPSPPLWSSLVAALVGLVGATSAARAQTHWTVDTKSSLAWWQVSPNLNHLWATTCPSEPSWRPGENRSPGWHIDPNLKLPHQGYGNVDDTIHVPLFPRHVVHHTCEEAVRGEVVVDDTVHWRGVRGKISVSGDALITGEAMRDNFMHMSLDTRRYPEMSFRIDSLVDVTEAGDTLRANAIGMFSCRGVNDTNTVAAVTIFPDGSGGRRVLAKWRVSAVRLFDYSPMIHRFGLGVNVWLWHWFFMGADLVVDPAGHVAAADSTAGGR